MEIWEEPITFWRAEYHSRHFSFEAFGVSRDGARTWDDFDAGSLGAIGDYEARCIWTLLGRSRADRLVFEDRAYILSTSETAGGRGINASMVIHTFNAPTRAIACSGGKAGKKLISPA